jgi:hypothetical protein
MCSLKKIYKKAFEDMLGKMLTQQWPELTLLFTPSAPTSNLGRSSFPFLRTATPFPAQRPYVC